MIEEKDRLEQKAMEDAKGGIPYEAPGLIDIDNKAGCFSGVYNSGPGGCQAGYKDSSVLRCLPGLLDPNHTVNSA